jgi:adenylate kinase
MYIIFYGPEGSGKSTQAKKTAETLNLPYLGSGDLVRKYAADDKGIMGDICRESLSKGYYVPDSEMYVLWKHRLKLPDVQNGWVLDGFPRNPSQAEFLEDKLDKYGKKIDFVFYLDVSEEESIRRLLKRSRVNPDGKIHDTEEKIKQRLKLYKKGEEDVLKLYEEKGVLKHINGEQSIDEIFSSVMEIIKLK